MKIKFVCFTLGLGLALVFPSNSQAQTDDLAAYIRQNYTRKDVGIPMRDGIKLYTVIYSPRHFNGQYPILLNRTPYGVGPYDTARYRGTLGPSSFFTKEGYIFVYQDVRGRYMSEGEFENVRPQRVRYESVRDIDESTDTFDTIDWLVKNVPGHNGKVGQWGISYPGFYTSAGMINAHPALKASSPQAPIADWFFDDFFHHGAFYLNHAFNFFAVFGQPRPEPTAMRADPFHHGTPDGYQFFMDLGPLKNVNRRYFKDTIGFWNKFVEHPNYDAFWQARNLLPHLKKVAPAVLTVGGWFDAEDLYGPLQTYRTVEKQNPGIFNVLVMGPWAHGDWSKTDASNLGNIDFGSNPSAFFQQHIELPFFNHFLKGKGENVLPEAWCFETGTNRWRKFDQWPPPGVVRQPLYLQAEGRLVSAPAQNDKESRDSFVSDPRRPVPYTQAISNSMTREFMIADQRFAARRPDVLTYQTEPLKEELTLAGPIRADLRVATTGTDADWVVKVIDVFPPDLASSSGRNLAGNQMMVRSEVIRGRFRNSYEKPEPFEPGKVTRVSLDLQDVLHTFKKGHRLMVQIHSTWFPLIDRNPQKFVPNIFLASDEDFIPAKHSVFRSGANASAIEVGVWRGNGK